MWVAWIGLGPLAPTTGMAGDLVDETAAMEWRGTAIGVDFGVGVGGVGDVDCDGFDDVAVADQVYADHGLIHLFRGSASGVEAVETLPPLVGRSKGEGTFGNAFAAAGDVNGDTCVDVVVADPGDGEVWWFSGGTDPAHDRQSVDLIVTSSVDGAGDTNGDGFADVMAGSTYGWATLLPGSSAGLTAASEVRISDASAPSLGQRVGGLGDLDGDGLDDVAATAGDEGMWVYRGDATLGVDPSAWTLTAPDWFWAVSGAGDVNGDGYEDIVGGLPFAAGYQGKAMVFYSSASGVRYSDSTTLYGSDPSGEFGIDVDGLGDVDGDGFSEVVIGAASAGAAPGTAAARVYPGSAAGIVSADCQTLWSPANSTGTNAGYANFGNAVRAAGDPNGDGNRDLIVGGWSYDDNTGRAYLFSGIHGDYSPPEDTGEPADSGSGTDTAGDTGDDIYTHDTSPPPDSGLDSGGEPDVPQREYVAPGCGCASGAAREGASSGLLGALGVAGLRRKRRG